MDASIVHQPRSAKVLRAHLLSILATVPDAMVVIDETGHILSFSTAAVSMFGYSEAEVTGRNVKLLMPQPDRQRHDGYLARYHRTGERRIIGAGRLTNARHRDGRTFPIELFVGEAEVGDQKIFTGFIRDLTERQQTLTRMQELQAELAHVARISEVATLASALAHELNQPLGAIANYCQAASLVLERMPRDATSESLKEIQEATTAQALRAGDIVHRLREFMSKGTTAHCPESLSQIVTEATALALVGTREQGIETEIDLHPEADTVLVDRVQVQQVLVNLIRNAVDAMSDTRHRQLQIRSRPIDTCVQVSVQDSGEGISEPIASRIFEPFITSKPGGMGVGLSICRSIIEAHGGRMDFEKCEPRGTKFTFVLPLAQPIETESS